MRKYVLSAALISALSTSALAGASTGDFQLSIAKSSLFTNQVADQKFADIKVTPTQDLSFADANHEISLGYMFNLQENMFVGLRLTSINPANYASENLITSKYIVTNENAKNLYNFETFTLENDSKFDQTLATQVTSNFNELRLNEDQVKTLGLDEIIKSKEFLFNNIAFGTEKRNQEQLTDATKIADLLLTSFVKSDGATTTPKFAIKQDQLFDISDAQFDAGTQKFNIASGTVAPKVKALIDLKLTAVDGADDGPSKALAKALNEAGVKSITEANKIGVNAFAESATKINFVKPDRTAGNEVNFTGAEKLNLDLAKALVQTIEVAEKQVADTEKLAALKKLGNTKKVLDLFGGTESILDVTKDELQAIKLGLEKKDVIAIKKIITDASGPGTTTAKSLPALKLIASLSAVPSAATDIKLDQLSKITDKDDNILDSVDDDIAFKAKVLEINNRISSINTAKGELTDLNFKEGVTTQAAKTIFLEVPFSFSTDLADNLTGGINFAPGYGSLTIVQTTTKQQTSGKMATLTSEQKGKTFSLSGEAFFDYRPTDSYSIRFVIGGSAFGAVETTNKLSFTKGGTDVTEMTSGLFKLNERKVDDANKPFFSMYNLKVGVGFNTSL